MYLVVLPLQYLQQQSFHKINHQQHHLELKSLRIKIYSGQKFHRIIMRMYLEIFQQNLHRINHQHQHYLERRSLRVRIHQLCKQILHKIRMQTYLEEHRLPHFSQQSLNKINYHHYLEQRKHKMRLQQHSYLQSHKISLLSICLGQSLYRPSHSYLILCNQANKSIVPAYFRILQLIQRTDLLCYNYPLLYGLWIQQSISLPISLIFWAGGVKLDKLI